MAVKDIKEPKGKDKKSSSGEDKPDGGKSPWQVSEDGVSRKRVGRKLPLEVRLHEFFIAISGAASLAGDSFTANAIEAKSEELAYGYAKLASVDPRVKRILSTLLEGSAWTEALIPTLGLVIVIGWHYGVVPDKLGVPFSLANGLVPVTRTEEMKMRAQAQRDQQEAAQRAQAEARAAQAQKDGNGDGDATR